MAVVLGSPPHPPIRLRWEDLDRSYDSLSDVGVDLQFVMEREFLDPQETRPLFTDSDGQRFRILVISLEVVLCVRVPDDFDPLQLTLRRVKSALGEMVVESLGSDDHRALLVETGEAVPIGAEFLVDDTAEVDPSSGGRTQLISSPSWLDFDDAWMRSVDPAPPVTLGTWLHNCLSALFRR